MTGRQLRIDDLARESGVSVRNVRAYQERGLLQPPQRVGRVAFYGEEHLKRLSVIVSLLERGYTLAHIAELVTLWQDGGDLADLMGLRLELTQAYSDEVADRGTPEQIAHRYDLAVHDLKAARESFELGLLYMDGAELVVPSPKLMRAGAELRRAGVPMDVLFDEIRHVRQAMEAIAERMSAVIVRDVIDPRLSASTLTPEVARELMATMRRLRPLAEAVVSSELARALQATAQRIVEQRWPTTLESPL
jgi:DNA-binding transcriptional MerR regulator